MSFVDMQGIIMIIYFHILNCADKTRIRFCLFVKVVNAIYFKLSSTFSIDNIQPIIEP